MASAQFPIPAPHILEMSLGPWLWGPIADLILMGAIVHMVIDYWSRYRESDGKVYKSLVFLVLIFNLLKSFQAIGQLWWKFVIHFGDMYTVMFISPWYVQLDPFTVQMCNILAQLFFSIRLYRLLGGLRWLLVPLVPSILMGLVGHIIMSVQAFNLTTVTDLQVFQTSMYVGLVGVMSADILITVSTSWYLLHSKTGFSRTDNLIFRLLHSTWITAALPSLSEFFNLIFYLTLVKKGDSLFMGFSYMSPKLYGVSMLYTLNSRQNFRSNENTYAMNSRLERMTGGISVTRDIVRVTDAPETHATSIRFATGGVSDTASSHQKGGFNIETDTAKSQEV
ncbi:hypothetical protein EXIGLDRAFT_845703 [Exidia glandulosa HHB12029]|uniref:DUF6534 domain-containing protein n=1 Tax=Exidia glandulosa HHB12029 TaxID=1314781 RepID=A0A165BBM4_EXIGL|nr:hypothetical protein EXIGLDRAFT_845703 [Exidia glandulosa HHB12029]